MRLAFVDLETTGGSPFEDRITEVGIIQVDLDALALSSSGLPSFDRSLDGLSSWRPMSGHSTGLSSPDPSMSGLPTTGSATSDLSMFDHSFDRSSRGPSGPGPSLDASDRSIAHLAGGIDAHGAPIAAHGSSNRSATGLPIDPGSAPGHPIDRGFAPGHPIDRGSATRRPNDRGPASRLARLGLATNLASTDGRSLPPIREWSTLVNPDAPIPPFIETLTGITNAMVADAPRFEDLAEDILARLDGRLFIAHNARFDHGFLKNAFRRLGHPFRPPVLCTVRLSRKLYPGYSRHNLDTLIERHRLVVDMRHRALGDARLLWQLWQRFHDALPAEQITKAIDQLTARPSLPRHLDPDVLDTLPKTAGVYLFHGTPDDAVRDGAIRDDGMRVDGTRLEATRVEEPRPLYIGKAKNLRQRVMAHFTGDHLSAREMEISQQMTRLEWIETGGGTQHDLGALLTEATLVKRLMPAYNRQLRKSDDVCAWRLVVDPGRRGGRPGWRLALARPDDLFFAQDPDLYGPFATPRQAGVTLRAIADAHGLCPALLKLDKALPGKPCFAHQVKRCRGACVGRETVAEHTRRLRDALASLAIRPWLFDGAIAFREGRSFHVLDRWAYLGMASTLDEARALAVQQRLFDPDVYRLMARRIDTLEVVRLDRDRSDSRWTEAPPSPASRGRWVPKAR